MQMIAYALVAVVVFLLVAGPLRARMFRKLQSRAPGDVYFSVMNRRPLAIALGHVMGTDAFAMTGSPCVVADSNGIAIWDNTPFEHVATIGWERVSSVDVNDAMLGDRRWPPSTILLSLGSGSDVVVLPLLRPNGSNRFLPPHGESAWLVSQLRLLRAAAAAV
jgi:hypothetical protein